MIGVIGMGYIGLPTALMLAASGQKVEGFDLDESKIDKLRRGLLTFEEIGMESKFDLARNNISFSDSLIETDMYIVCVPTPYDLNSKKIDPSYVVDAVKTVLEIAPDNSIVVIESTVSPGTIDKYIRPLIKNKIINLVHCPERILPGNMIYELEYNARTIGCDDAKIGSKVESVYRSFCKGEIVLTDIKTAEMTKVIENTFRDINIAFANELVKICEKGNLDVHEIIRIANMHPRVNILNPGPGVGGHCISVDPWFLVGDYPEETKLIYEARKINDSMPEYVIKKIKKISNEKKIDASRIGIYGISYKENVDDVRESPTLQLMEHMENHFCTDFVLYDPYVKEKIFVNQVFSLSEFLENVDLVVVMVGHNEIKEHMNLVLKKTILDTRNICANIQGVYKL